MTPAEFQATACALLMTTVGWQTAIARRLEVAPRTVRRWLVDGAVPPWVDARLAELTGQTAIAPWPRDEWLIGDTAGGDGRRREYIAHLQTPRFIARVVVTDPATGLPIPTEDPADVVSGTVYAVDDETVLCELAWTDRCAPGEVVKWLEAAAEVVLSSL